MSADTISPTPRLLAQAEGAIWMPMNTAVMPLTATLAS